MDQKLIVFIEVAKKRNFTRAAEALHMTQPAVSQYIASLERELDVKLLDRDNKSVQLNKAGEIVLQYAKYIANHYEQMKLLVTDLKNNPSGDIKIGASYTIGEYVLPAILTKLQLSYPDIAPHVTIGNTEVIGDKLINHEIDIGLIEGSFSHPTIVKQCFSTDEMYIISHAGSPLLKNNKNMMEKLAKETWIIREKGSGTRTIVEGFLNEQKLEPDKVLTFGSTQIIKETVESGIGVSLLSKAVINKELQLGTIGIIHVEDTPLTRNFSIIKNKQEFYPKAMQVFESILLNSV